MAARQSQFGVDRPLLIFDDMRVMFTPGRSGRIGLDVRTYETVGHDCPLRDAKLWDASCVTAYWEMSTCLDFLRVEYRRDHATDVDPPSDWARMTYDEGRVIAYSESEPNLICVRTQATTAGMSMRAAATGVIDQSLRIPGQQRRSADMGHNAPMAQPSRSARRCAGLRVSLRTSRGM
ncbi:MAG: hypothetical protein HKN91_17710 [Acidimicrobiia bacterium]|nr:hypothetical protein [Acidimicrobiia bacterium]